MPFKGSDEGTIGFPQPHDVVKASGGDGGAVGAIRYIKKKDLTGLTFKGGDEGAVRFPQPRGSVRASGGNGAAVRTILYIKDLTGMSFKGSDGPAVLPPTWVVLSGGDATGIKPCIFPVGILGYTGYRCGNQQ